MNSRKIFILIVPIFLFIVIFCKPKEITTPEVVNVNPDPSQSNLELPGDQEIIVTFSKSIQTELLDISGTMIPPNESPLLAWSTDVLENDTLTINPPDGEQWVDSGYGMFTLILDSIKDTDEQMMEELPYIIRYKIDTTPPIAEISNTPDPVTNQTSINLYIEGTDVSYYKYLIDDDDNDWDWSNATEFDTLEPIQESGLTEGSHTIKVRAKDNVGNWQLESEVTSYSWEIDVTPAVASLSNLPPSLTNQTSINVSVSGTDVEAYKYLIDDASNDWNWENAIENDKDDPIIETGLFAGSHELRVIARDAVGNWQGTEEGEYTSHVWDIDTTQNIVQLDNLPDNPTNDSTYNVTVSGDGVIAYKYDFADNPNWDNINEILLTDNDIISGDFDTGGNFDGLKSLKVIGRNDLGTWQSTPTTYNWVVDTTNPPETTFISTPDDRTNDGFNLNWQWQNMESVDTGTPISYSYMLEKVGEPDPITDWTNTLQRSYTKNGTLASGTYIFYVKVLDLAENESSSISVQTVIDTVPPTATSLPVSGSEIDYTLSSITITFDEEMDPDYELSGSLIDGLIEGTDYTATWNSTEELELSLNPGKSWNTGTGRTLDLRGCKDLVGYDSTTVLTFDVNMSSVSTLYVTETGIDSNNGTIDYPKQTISNAIQTLANGGYNTGNPAEVHIGAGIYEVTEPIILKEGISIMGGYKVNGGVVDDGDRNITPDARSGVVTGYQTVISYIGSDDGEEELPTSAIYAEQDEITDVTLLEGFMINGSTGGYYSSAVLIRTGAGPLVQNNTIDGGSGQELSVGIYCRNAEAQIANNILDGGNAITETNGIFNYASAITVDNNDINSGSGDHAYGISNESCYTNVPTITNNTINGGNGVSNSRGINNSLALANISSNTINGGDAVQAYGIYNTTSSPTIDNNVIDGGSGGIRSYGIFNTTNSNPVITANTLDGGDGISVSNGIENNSQSSPYIINNEIFGGSSLNAIGVRNYGASNPYIYNNTINGGTQDNAVCIYVTVSSKPFIVNNLLYTTQGASGGGFGIFEYDATSDPQQVENNNFHNCIYYYDKNDGSGGNEVSNLTSNIDNESVSNTLGNWNNYNASVSFNSIDTDDISLMDYGISSPPADIQNGGQDLSSVGDYPEDTGNKIDKDGTIRTISWSIGAYEYD
jgi:hypothetical protein